MYPVRLLASLGIVLLVVLGSGVAAAGEASFGSEEACIDAMSQDLRAGHCVSFDGDTWTLVGSGTAGGFGDPSGGFGSLIGTLLVVGILWCLVPFGIAAWLASSRGESIGAAVLLTLVLGWVGVAIVWYGIDRTRRAAAAALEPPPAD